MVVKAKAASEQRRAAAAVSVLALIVSLCHSSALVVAIDINFDKFVIGRCGVCAQSLPTREQRSTKVAFVTSGSKRVSRLFSRTGTALVNLKWRKHRPT